MQMESKRQLFHLVFGLVLVFLIHIEILTALIIGLVIIIGISLSLICKKTKIPAVDWFLKTFEREKDRKIMPGKGIIFMLIGVFIAVLFFDKNIAMASVMILALGDSVAPLVGRYGKIKHPMSSKKYLEGAVAGFAAGFLGALLFVNVYAALFGALGAMIVEGIDLEIEINPLDDNIIIPVVASIIMVLI